MDKTFLIQQLMTRIKEAYDRSIAAGQDSRADAQSGAQRAVNLARAQTMRELGAKESLDALERFRPRPLRKGEPIGLGAVVEVEGEAAAHTLFIAPVGAGQQLTGPGGDGDFLVVTPASPFGRALIGKRIGDEVQVPVRGEPVDFQITFAG